MFWNFNFGVRLWWLVDPNPWFLQAGHYIVTHFWSTEELKPKIYLNSDPDLGRNTRIIRHLPFAIKSPYNIGPILLLVASLSLSSDGLWSRKSKSE